MKQEVEKLLRYIVDVVGLNKEKMPNYYFALPVCILDAIFSPQSKYDSITIPTLNRFAIYFLNGNLYISNYNIEDFINDLESCGVDFIVDNIINNHQKLGGRRKIDICYDVAKKLKALGILNIDDFNNYRDKDLLTNTLRSIKGIGPVVLNYLKMLCGDSNKVYSDKYIHQCVRDALGYDVSNEKCQMLFFEVSKMLNSEYGYNNITPRYLDGIVWRYYSFK